MSFFEFDHLTPLHEGYAASVGRTLAVCQHIECCAHHVMVIVAVTDEIRDDRDDDEHLRKTATGLRNVSFGGSVKRLSDSGDFGENASALEVGRIARNWLAHEACDVMQVGFGLETLLERIREFHTQLKALCEADRLLSVASYEISEKEPGSAGSHRYAARLEKWAFAPILDAIGRVVATPADEDAS